MKSLINKLFPHTKSQEEVVITQSSLFKAKVPNYKVSESDKPTDSHSLKNTRFVQPVQVQSPKVA